MIEKKKRADYHAHGQDISQNLAYNSSLRAGLTMYSSALRLAGNMNAIMRKTLQETGNLL